MTVTAQELADIQSHAAEFLTATCDVLRVTRTGDADGGWSEDWEAVFADVACRLAPAGGAVISILGEHPDRAHFYVLNGTHDLELTAADRVVIDDLTYKVRHPVDNTGIWRIVRQYIVEQEAEEVLPFFKLSGINDLGNGVGHAMLWDYEIDDDDEHTIVADGTQDISRGMYGLLMVSSSSGAYANATSGLATPATAFVQTEVSIDGDYSVVFKLYADGHMTVTRAIGAETYKVAMFLLWI
jgi:hypothetical protein